MRVALLTTDNREHFKDYGNPNPYFGTAPEALLQGFSEMRGLEVHVISCIRQPVNAPAKLAENIYFHSLVVPKFGWMTTGFQGCVRAIRRLLHRIQPDIVHGQGTERECAMAAVFSGFPNVLTIHGNMAELARMFGAPTGSYPWLAARLETLCLRRTVGVFCNSAYTESLVQPRARRTWRVANALRQQFFRPATTTPLPDRCLILNIGVISPRKRQLELLDIARIVHEQNRSCTFGFVGAVDPNQEYAAKFLRAFAPLERSGAAVHLGTKNTQQLIDTLDESSALVHFPSEEAFGLVAAEALARNNKFFGARLGGLIDIAEGMPEAELFNVNDFSTLGRSISEWAATGPARRPPTSNLIRKRYHPSVIAARHEQIYREVVGL